MSKEKLIPYSDYFDEYTVDIYNYKYKKCLDFIEQNYDPLKRSKLGFQPGQYYTEYPRATPGFLVVLLLLCSIKQSIDTIRLDKKMEKKWLANLNELAKNEETAEHEYHASLNEDVRKEKTIYSSYLLESRRSKHQIDREEEMTSTKRQKDLTNVSLENDGRSNTTNVAYSGKIIDDRSILESADSKMNKGNNNLHSSSSAPSSDFDREEGNKKRTFKILYSWEDAINKIDFKNTSKKDILEGYNISSEFWNFQQSTIQQVKEKLYLYYKQDIQKILANSKSSASNKENIIKCKKPNFKLMSNKGDEILFGEVKPKDSLSISTKKDLVKLANFQADALNDLIKKYGNRIGIISLGARIRIYEMDLNYDGVYRMILIANVITPIEHAQFLNLVPVLEAFYNIKHRISKVLTVIASNTPPNSPSCSTYGRVSTPSPKPVRITIAGLRPN
ncbi:6942_t:CDS:10 [Scutellospora calospora]|uniref:6942_t:CDS:1 n=1 Tax=Scutellospora calospora TaxID=85575 RepID=A0ACA9JWI7_9GLOM|nr:6942_t:CDS:10 [Scutellospora calospora]